MITVSPTKRLTHQKVFWFDEQIGILLCGRHRVKSVFIDSFEFIQFLQETGITFLNCSNWDRFTVNNNKGKKR